MVSNWLGFRLTTLNRNCSEPISRVFYWNQSRKGWFPYMIATITASIAIAAKMFSDRCDHKKNYSATIVAIVVKKIADVDLARRL